MSETMRQYSGMMFCAYMRLYERTTTPYRPPSAKAYDAG